MFALHVIPERNIYDWPDWLRLIANVEGRVVDEYGVEVSLSKLTETVTDRTWRGSSDLRRHSDRVSEGAGTWDLISGEFS